jgi:hypothetical protein
MLVKTTGMGLAGFCFLPRGVEVAIGEYPPLRFDKLFPGDSGLAFGGKASRTDVEEFSL